VLSTNHLEIRDRAKVLTAAGVFGGVGNLGTVQSQFGVRSNLAEALSVGPLFFQSYANVSGLAASRGAIERQAGVTIGVSRPNTVTSVVVIVRDHFVDRGKVVATNAGSSASLVVLGDQLLFERPVSGLSGIAPKARVTVTSQATPSRMGTLVGSVVELQPDVVLSCDRGAKLPLRN